MRAYIIGAGASQSYSRSPTGVRPTLAKNFFSAFHKLEISADRHVLIGYIVNYVRDTRGIHPAKFNLWQEHVEEFMAEIQNVVSNSTRFKELPLDYRIPLSQAYTQMLFL